ncbi:MAG: MFS transporter [Gaiellaceae bacterium]
MLYDVAYSTFAFLFAVRYFPPWIVDELHRPDWYVSGGLAGAVATVVVLSPLVGRYADRRGRRKHLLAIFTFCACALTAALSFLSTAGNVLPVLVVAASSVAFGQLAIAQFDPLLAEISDDVGRSRLSGFAVGFGFLGTIAGLVLLSGAFVGSGSKQHAFLPLALIYASLAVPALKMLPTNRPAARRTNDKHPLALLVSPDAPRARRFVIARFLYCDALLTVSGFLTVYMDRVGGFSENAQSAVLGVAVVAAGAGALATGQILPTYGPRRAIMVALPFAAAALALTAVVAAPWTVWVGAPTIGAALGVVWSADRIFMLRVTPEATRGQWFAYFNSANRSATAVGPLIIWSGLVWILSGQNEWTSELTASRFAIAVLALTACCGWLIVRATDDREPISHASAR